MSSVIHVDIDHIAKLARLSLIPEEKESLAREVDSIAGFLSEIQHVVIPEGVITLSEHRNVFAPDAVTETSGSHTKQLIADSAPKSVGDYLSVPQVITAGKHS
jgi:aspartyl/glutamyl-tRNA(Asn/Gln) amidotransferase C subunit